jgi:hypothetical protein
MFGVDASVVLQIGVSALPSVCHATCTRRAKALIGHTRLMMEECFFLVIHLQVGAISLQ